MDAKRRVRAASVGAMLVALLALGADGPTQKVAVKGLSFQAPAAWKSSPPASTMRLAQLAIEPEKGDKDPGELQVFAFPGGAGSVDANVKRWQGQFVGADGNPPKITSEKRKGKNVDVTFVECAGRYVAAVRPGSDQKLDKPDWHLLGAIVETSGTAFFLKLIGPDATVKAAKPGFDDLIGSLTVDAP